MHSLPKKPSADRRTDVSRDYAISDRANGGACTSFTLVPSLHLLTFNHFLTTSRTCPPTMAPTPNRIAMTSSEVKKLHKKNGGYVNERQQKQLERSHELEQRAIRLREAEERRKIANKRRKEREEKEKAARRQMGVGLATQMIGYSHTQRQLKNNMEAFLGVSKRKEEEKRKRELELTKKLEEIAQELENEPWDDDEDADELALVLPVNGPSAVPGEPYDDFDLDDDTLLEVDALIKSDPVEEPPAKAPNPPLPPPPSSTTSTKPIPPKDDAEFVRLHGPAPKAIEAILDKLPGPLIELLSQDMSMRAPEWDPPLGLLHKLNPLGLPPHRLRIKVGSIVTLLRDLNTSSQLSKSQHLRILRAENDRLECLVLDGQLEGTKAFLTRVPFDSKHRNEEQYTFRRSQFPVRVATDFTPSSKVRNTIQSGFKLPSVSSEMRPLAPLKKRSPNLPLVKPPVNPNPGFKLPGLPASKTAVTSAKKSTTASEPVSESAVVLDDWADFLESGTQIARELAVESPASKKQSLPTPAAKLHVTESLPPLSTQDLDFSMDEVDDDDDDDVVRSINMPASRNSNVIREIDPPRFQHQTVAAPKPMTVQGPTDKQLPPVRSPRTKERLTRPIKTLPKRRETNQNVKPLDLSTLRASQRPPSVSDRPGLKRKNWVAPPPRRPSSAKRPCVEPPRPSTLPEPVQVAKTSTAFSDFGISTQDAASFFVDDDELSFGGSPPIAV